MLFSKVAPYFSLLASTAMGHIAMSLPVPYGNPDTSPLSPSGSNYPCKSDNGFKINSVANMPVGAQQSLAFKGTAVHGGGSCQLSLTPGFTPTADSAFKVIYSIEGGCPGTDGTTSTYSFSVPADVPNGNYSLAWTWFNRIGNREMYMNCAPITVSSSTGTDSSFNSLPDMAIYNIQSKNSCGTAETYDVAFPNPGKDVTTGAGYKPTPPSNCGSQPAASAAVAVGAGGAVAGAASVGAAGASAGAAVVVKNGQAAAAAQVTGTSTLVTTTTAVTQQTAVAGFAEGVGAPSSAAAAVATGASVLPPVVAAASSAASPAGAGAAGGQPCSAEGALICSGDGKMQGLCNGGTAVMMPVAPGTKCANGAIGFAKVRRRGPKYLGWN